MLKSKILKVDRTKQINKQKITPEGKDLESIVQLLIKQEYQK